MTPEAARNELHHSVDDEEDMAVLIPSVLSKLTVDDVPEGARYEIGTHEKSVTILDWSGRFFKKGGILFGEADHTWTRKYWYSPLGMEQYLDLVRRAVEARQRRFGDVAVTSYDDDGAYIHLRYSIAATEKNLDRVYKEIIKIDDEIREAADQAVDEVGVRIAEIAARLSGWGESSLDILVDAVDLASNSDEKGRALEELCARLFASISGFSVKQRIRTETEEIDISIINGSNDPIFVREGAVILVECKNWSGRCGKNEFVVFHEKARNRSNRCTLGYIVSWNGFAETITKEMLRGSREDILIVPMTGADIRAAVRSGDFLSSLQALWNNAVSI